jgi:urea transport system ATP-binding protein
VTTGTEHGSIIYLEDVTVDFDGFKALRNLNFIVNYRELRVVIGPNGAGKTTLLDVISGKVQPVTGRVIFGKDMDLIGRPEHEIATLGIGRKFQTPSVYTNLTVFENLDLSLRRSSKGVLATLLSTWSSLENERIVSMLATIGLADKTSVRAGALSHGEKQWLEIGMVLLQDPALLLVDEPVAGMTDRETEQTGLLLQSLADRHSIIVIEHDMEFVRQIARTITVLHEGTVLCEGPVEKIQSDPRVVEIYLGRQRVADVAAR